MNRPPSLVSLSLRSAPIWILSLLLFTAGPGAASANPGPDTRQQAPPDSGSQKQSSEAPEKEAADEEGSAQDAPPAKPAAKDPVLFVDIATLAGLDFRHNSAPEKKYILESMSGGVALFDYDGDGLLDIYFVNALTVDTADQPEEAPSAL